VFYESIVRYNRLATNLNRGETMTDKIKQMIESYELEMELARKDIKDKIITEDVGAERINRIKQSISDFRTLLDY